MLCPNLKSPKPLQVKTKITLSKPIKRKEHHMSKENQAKAKMRKLEHIVEVLASPEKRLKLSLALAEINRRLAGQMLIWKMLPCQTG